MVERAPGAGHFRHSHNFTLSRLIFTISFHFKLFSLIIFFIYHSIIYINLYHYIFFSIYNKIFILFIKFLILFFLLLYFNFYSFSNTFSISLNFFSLLPLPLISKPLFQSQFVSFSTTPKNFSNSFFFSLSSFSFSSFNFLLNSNHPSSITPLFALNPLS